MKALISKEQEAFEKDLLQALFAGFVERGVRHAVLRNYESLPYSVGARDIDIVVLPDDHDAACAVVTQIASTKGLRFGNYFSDERLTQFALVSRDETGGLLQIKIDFFIRSEVYGIEFFSADQMLVHAWAHNGVAVVSSQLLLLDKWIFHLLVGRPLHCKYDARFSEIAQAEGRVLSNNLRRFLPESRATELVAKLAERRGSTLVLSSGERRRALVRLWSEQGVAALRRSARFIGYRLRDQFFPKGIFLSISGPDGSGKTTVIDMVVAQLRAIYGEDSVHYSHFRPGVLPRIAEMARKAGAIEEVDEEYERPHRAEPSGLAGSLMRLVYYLLDYMFGYFRRVRPILKRREVVLFDRYYYDMIADSFRSRVSLPLPLLRAMGRVLPLPQYAFFIHAEPEEIRRRKQELSLDRIVELNQRYQTLADLGWLIPIDNNKEPEAAAIAIVDHIVADRHALATKKLR